VFLLLTIRKTRNNKIDLLGSGGSYEKNK
jgi:hypothetical protein